MTVQPPESSLSTDQIEVESTTQEHPLAQAGRQVGDMATDAAQRGTNLGIQRADQGRERAADGLNQLAGTIRRVSGDLETDQPTIANVASAAADQTEKIARYLRETDARQLINAVEDLARRQPLIFLGGAFLLGVAAARLLKAGTPASNATRMPMARYETGSHRYIDPSSAGYRPTGPGATDIPVGTADIEEVPDR
jgi:hypothetical protein